MSKAGDRSKHCEILPFGHRYSYYSHEATLATMNEPTSTRLVYDQASQFRWGDNL